MKENVTIKCADSVTLEGVLEIPESTGPQMPAALVCHPHPLYGGNMSNNVVSALCESFVSSGVAALRFNFRGVGESAGKHGEGISETIDVTACLDLLCSDSRFDRSKLVLSGYSFGSWVAMKTAASDERPSRLIMISPPVDMYDFSFLSSEKRPKLMIAGDNDFVCSIQKYNELIKICPDPCISVLLKGHDHFHWGSEADIKKNVRDFMQLHPF